MRAYQLPKGGAGSTWRNVAIVDTPRQTLSLEGSGWPPDTCSSDRSLSQYVHHANVACCVTSCWRYVRRTFGGEL